MYFATLHFTANTDSTRLIQKGQDMVQLITITAWGGMEWSKNKRFHTY